MNGASLLFSDLERYLYIAKDSGLDKKKMEAFIYDFSKLKEVEAIIQAHLLRDRVLEIGQGKLKTKQLFHIFRHLTQVCKDETYVIKNDNFSITVSLPLVVQACETIKLATSSGISSAKGKYIIENKYGKIVFDILEEFFEKGYVSCFTLDNVYEVFECAKELQITWLEAACRSFLENKLPSSLNKENVLDYYYWSFQYDEFTLLPLCVNFIRKIPIEEYADLTPHFRWKDLTFTILKLSKEGCINLLDSSIYINGKISEFRHIINALNPKEIRFQDSSHVSEDFATHIESILSPINVTYIKIHLKEFKTLEAITTVLKKNETVKTLKLGYFELSEEGVALIADMLLENNTLSELDLTASEINEKGAVAVAKAITKNRTLRILSLNRNSIRCSGLKAIAKALMHNSTVYKLDLTSNKIGKDGMLALAEMLNNNKTLKELSLNGNNLTSEDTIPLAASLLNHPSIQEISLSDNRIDIVAALRFNQIANQNASISRIDLYSNKIKEEDWQEERMNNKIRT